jgi:uncharacterized protein YgbK (DUF1537 family)
MTWEEADLEWALALDRPAVYVISNSRSLAPADAAARTREIAERALAVSQRLGRPVTFVSRSDSTLRGHFPLEPDVLAATMAASGQGQADAVLLVPAFPAAGRITVHGVHYCVAGDEATPAGESQFARDATFGYRSSLLPDWVEEKTGGRVAAADVVTVPVEASRQGPAAVEPYLDRTGGAVIAPDAVTEGDLQVLAQALHAVEDRGRRLILRTGPSFPRAYIGQEPAPPLTADRLPVPAGLPAGRGGLVVVGSHVPLTTRQLDGLTSAFPATPVIEVDVAAVLDPARRDAHLDAVVATATAALDGGDAIVHTSRSLVTGADADASLDVARRVSDAVSAVVARVLGLAKPRFVVAKGGITSSDVALTGLGIRHAWVEGPMFPGTVSLWRIDGGPADGIPYIVFPGNVGDERSLADVVARFHTR